MFNHLREMLKKTWRKIIWTWCFPRGHKKYCFTNLFKGNWQGHGLFLEFKQHWWRKLRLREGISRVLLKEVFKMIEKNISNTITARYPISRGLKIPFMWLLDFLVVATFWKKKVVFLSPSLIHCDFAPCNQKRSWSFNTWSNLILVKASCNLSPIFTWWSISFIKHLILLSNWSISFLPHSSNLFNNSAISWEESNILLEGLA